MKFFVALWAVVCIIGMTSCYQVHSDDDLRAVPTTNNPNILPNGGKLSNAPKMGY